MGKLDTLRDEVGRNRAYDCRFTEHKADLRSFYG